MQLLEPPHHIQLRSHRILMEERWKSWSNRNIKRWKEYPITHIIGNRFPLYNTSSVCAHVRKSATFSSQRVLFPFLVVELISHSSCISTTSLTSRNPVYYTGTLTCYPGVSLAS